MTDDGARKNMMLILSSCLAVPTCDFIRLSDELLRASASDELNWSHSTTSLCYLVPLVCLYSIDFLCSKVAALSIP
ncbi:hypothetical protein L1887_06617 [Cichorium endivia]|nr:hypothetical protein L1887_06617 [Cichorium endivia]